MLTTDPVVNHGTITVTVRARGGETVDVVQRIPRKHVGWSSVRYHGKRYQVFGGIRASDLWITVDGRGARA